MKRIVDIIGTPVAISPSKAEDFYNDLAQTITNKRTEQYSFNGIADFSSAFCNASIGKIYMNFPPSLVSQFISFTDFDSENIWELKIMRAIKLGSDEGFRNNSQQALEDILSE